MLCLVCSGFRFLLSRIYVVPSAGSLALFALLCGLSPEFVKGGLDSLW